MVNVATAVAAIVAIRIASTPADVEYPYGYSKAGSISIVVVGTPIIVPALAILREAYGAFLDPTFIKAPWSGLAVASVATALNVFWSLLLIRQGRIRRSAALVADGKHLMADLVTSIGVLIGSVGVVLTGILQFDAGIAALVAPHVQWSGWGVIRENTSGLLDEAVAPAALEAIRGTISAHADGALEIHALRTRHAGRITFIDFHLVVPAAMPTEQAHDICDRIEDAPLVEQPSANVTIHVEPERKVKRVGVPVL